MSTFQKSAGAIIYYEDSGEIKFLMLKYPTYWGFAKGIIEEGEDIGGTVNREVEEETGLKDFKIIPGFKQEQKWFFRHDGELIHKQATYYLIRVSKEDSKKVKISKEHDDFAWVTIDEADKKIKIKQNKEMLEKALEFIREYEKQARLPG